MILNKYVFLFFVQDNLIFFVSIVHCSSELWSTQSKIACVSVITSDKCTFPV